MKEAGSAIKLIFPHFFTLILLHFFRWEDERECAESSTFQFSIKQEQLQFSINWFTNHWRKNCPLFAPWTWTVANLCSSTNESEACVTLFSRRSAIVMGASSICFALSCDLFYCSGPDSAILGMSRFFCCKTNYTNTYELWRTKGDLYLEEASVQYEIKLE